MQNKVVQLNVENKFLSKFYLSERWEIEKQLVIQTVPLKNILTDNNFQHSLKIKLLIS